MMDCSTGRKLALYFKRHSQVRAGKSVGHGIDYRVCSNVGIDICYLFAFGVHST